jgi:chorismate mutase-like protein
MSRPEFPELESMREMISQLDIKLIAILGERVDICRHISLYKKTHHIPVMQPSRIGQVNARCENLSKLNGLDANFINTLYDLIIEETCRVETEIMEAQLER